MKSNQTQTSTHSNNLYSNEFNVLKSTKNNKMIDVDQICELEWKTSMLLLPKNNVLLSNFQSKQTKPTSNEFAMKLTLIIQFMDKIIKKLILYLKY